jgi:hypothetical protein
MVEGEWRVLPCGTGGFWPRPLFWSRWACCCAPRRRPWRSSPRGFRIPPVPQPPNGRTATDRRRFERRSRYAASPRTVVTRRGPLDDLSARDRPVPNRPARPKPTPGHPWRSRGPHARRGYTGVPFGVPFGVPYQGPRISRPRSTALLMARENPRNRRAGRPLRFTSPLTLSGSTREGIHGVRRSPSERTP